jgi:acetyl esterase
MVRYNGMIHGFYTMSGVLDTARQALADSAAWLRRTLDDA